ncbi:MAG TPA: hypothetical protein VK190_04630 [Pseudoneobacillus sp.]|nr:hypothetical protein [Pseudoneobacillus sp.]
MAKATVIAGTRVGVLKSRTTTANTKSLTVEISEKTYKRLEKRIAGNKRGSKSLLTEQALISLLDTLDVMEALKND